MSPGPTLDWQLALAIALLVAIALAAARVGRLPTARDGVTAVARAVVQLMAVVVVIRVVFESVWLAFGFALVMLTVATLTSASRSGARAAAGWIAASLLAGVAPVLCVVFVSRSTPLTAPAVVAISGIVIGGAMTACSLVLRRAFASLRERRGQIEAALALGIDRPHAIRLVVDADRPEALVPVLDQTRTVGLVTLPGAFVGVLLGGGSAGQAAAAQLVVLVGLIAAESVTVVVAGYLVAAGRILSPDISATLPPA